MTADYKMMKETIRNELQFRLLGLGSIAGFVLRPRQIVLIKKSEMPSTASRSFLILAPGIIPPCQWGSVRSTWRPARQRSCRCSHDRGSSKIGTSLKDSIPSLFSFV